MSGWIAEAVSTIRAGADCALVTVCSVEGSAPREPGTAMVVKAAGTYGTIGGGNLEHQAIKQARAMLMQSRPRAVLQDYPLGPLLAQCCGGHVRLLFERLVSEDLAWLTQAQAALHARTTPWRQVDLVGHRVTLIEAGGPIGFEDTGGRALASVRAPKADCAHWKGPVGAPLTPIAVFGAGHVGAATARAVHPLAVALSVFDPRPDYQSPIAPYGIPVLPIDAATPQSTVAALPAGAHLLVMTHSHEIDYAIVRASLERADLGICGLIGSLTKRARFLSRLQRDRLTERAEDRLICPIGDIGLSGKSPETIALGIAVDIAGRLEDARAAPAPAACAQHRTLA